MLVLAPGAARLRSNYPVNLYGNEDIDTVAKCKYDFDLFKSIDLLFRGDNLTMAILLTQLRGHLNLTGARNVKQRDEADQNC